MNLKALRDVINTNGSDVRALETYEFEFIDQISQKELDATHVLVHEQTGTLVVKIRDESNVKVTGAGPDILIELARLITAETPFEEKEEFNYSLLKAQEILIKRRQKLEKEKKK